MKKLLFMSVAFVSFAQAHITQEDAKLILNDELAMTGCFTRDGERDSQADKLVTFAQACMRVGAKFGIKSNGPSHINLALKYSWEEHYTPNYRVHVYGKRQEINCAQLLEIMEKMEKNTEKYDSDTVDRLKKTSNEIRNAKSLFGDEK